MTTPKNIDANESRIKIEWSDGNIKEYAARMLRAACQCASCVSEVTGQQILDVAKIPHTLQITHAEPTGNYAISVNFSDGHKSGIYTYVQLFKLAVN